MVGYTGCAQKLLTNVDQRGALFSISFFMKTGTSADLLCPKCYIDRYFDGYGRTSGFSEYFRQKIPPPSKA